MTDTREEYPPDHAEFVAARRSGFNHMGASLEQRRQYGTLTLARSAARHFAANLDDVLGYLRVAGFGEAQSRVLTGLRDMLWATATGAPPAATADTDRMNWLEQNRPRLGLGENGECRLFARPAGGECIAEAFTIRKAVDVARRSAPPLEQTP